jgi:pimeloyl-ACP methyl ester carboxylesterase
VNRGGIARRDFRDLLNRVRTPTLVICGECDRIISPRWSRALQVSLPQSRLIQLPGSAHLPHVEEPDAFCGIVTEFLMR